MRRAAIALALSASLPLVFGPATAFGQIGATAEWQPLLPAPGAIDLAGPRGDGRLYLAESSRGLSLFRPGHAATPYADGPEGYAAPPGEPYIALAPGGRVRGAGCSFRRGELFALDPGAHPGVVRIDRRGRAKRFTSLPAGTFPSGITFDEVGRFGGRLLVTMRFEASVDVLGIDCHGRVSKLISDAPQVEGGIAVAPASFGPYGGSLIAADEFSGRIYALRRHPDGAELIADSALATGADTGVESVGFVPPGFGPGDAAYLADFAVPGNPFPGTGSVLVGDGASLSSAGVAPGDLLVATEGGGETIRVRCDPGCGVTVVASGPDVAHAEGHIVFAAAP